MARSTVIVALAFVAVACTSLGDIQDTRPVRSLYFEGSHKAMAQCVQRRLAGRLLEEADGERYVIYNSVKGEAGQGLSHYAITVRSSGFAEWRVMAPATSGQFGRNVVSPAAVQTYWTPVQDCAAQAKPAA